MQKAVLKSTDILESGRPVVVRNLTDLIHAKSLEHSEIFVPIEFSLPDATQNNVENFPHVVDPSKNIPTDGAKNETSQSGNSAEGETQEAEKMSALDTEVARADIELEKEQVINQAHTEGEEIKKNAEQEREQILSDAKTQSEAIIKEATENAEKIKKESDDLIASIKQEAEKEARDKGYLEGAENSKEELERLLNLLRRVTSEMMTEKIKILSSIEEELVDLVLMIASKVVKGITESYKKVVFDNVVAALGKLRIKTDVIVRVNPEDLPSMEKYKTALLKEVEGVENLQFLEDPQVDKGGCIVTSEFASVDARISSQLAEIEEQIRHISPIKEI